MSSISIQTDFSESERFLDALPREIYNAQRSAIRTTTTFASKLLSQKLADATGIKQSAFKQLRIRSFIAQDAKSARIWFGYRPLAPILAGKLEQETTGASAGSYFFQGGFVATMRSGHTGIFKRVRKARLPIKEQFIKLPQAESIMREVSEVAERELLTRFTQKLEGYIERRESAQ